jgi:hypothetical protein
MGSEASSKVKLLQRILEGSRLVCSASAKVNKTFSTWDFIKHYKKPLSFSEVCNNLNG